MNYTDVISFFNQHSMKQDEAIDLIQEELYSNNYTFIEQIIEEYVLGLNQQELETLMNTIRNTYYSEG